MVEQWRPATATIPTQPGVYRFADSHGRILYVGKAKNLRNRLTNYFQKADKLHPRTRAMVASARQVEWTLVRSEVEALLLEHTWIKEFDPRYNVVFRDDKSYPYLALTWQEEFPRIFITREKRNRGERYFGPYARAGEIRATLETLLSVLPVRSCTKTVFNRAQRQDRPCLLGYIDKCSAPCVDRISAVAHRELVEQVAQVLSGDAKPLMRQLEKKMNQAAAAEDFERAAQFRDRLRALTNVLDLNAVVLSDSANLDLISIQNEELEAAAHVFFVRRGRIVGERGWIIEKPAPLTYAETIRATVLELYAAPNAQIPAEILVPELPAEVTTLTEWLRERKEGRVAFSVPTRGKRQELAATGRANAAAVWQRHRQKRAGDIVSRSAALTELQEYLSLPEAPLRIECFDISHTGGTNQMASMVVFEDGLPAKSHYRTFSLPDGVDDLTAMRMVLERRFARGQEEAQSAPTAVRFAYPPQLLVVDGGAGQVQIAGSVLADLGVTDVAVIGLAKRLEEVWLPDEDFPIILPRGAESLYLLQRVRDEAHRFAIQQHRRKRGKAMQVSVLDDIPQIGTKRAQTLLRHFGSVPRLKAASVELIAAVPGIGRSTAEKIFAALHPEDGMLEP